MKKKLKVALLTVLTAVCLVAVCFFAGCKVDYAAIYNDDAKIISSNGYTAVSLTASNDSNEYSCECSKFSGVMKAVSNFNVGENTTASLSQNVEAGDFKLVLTSSNTVYVLAEGSYDGTLTFDGIPEGKYMLKMVGLGAKFNLTLSY